MTFLKPIFQRPQALLAPLVALAIHSGAQADDATPDSVRLDAVHVTATTPSTQSSVQDARDEVARTPGGATVVTAADLRDQRAGTLSDALAEAAGVFAQSRFGAQEMRLSIRGSGLQRTFHTRGIEVLQDGIPLNLADGSGDFQSIDVLAADHLEVFRGANALQFGGANLGGSVNFVSPTGYTAPTELRAEGGSFGYQRAYAQTGITQGAWDAFAAGGYYATDGARDHSQQREFRFTSNVGLKLANGIENRTFITLSRSDSELPGSLTRAQLDADPSQANAGNVAGDQQRDTRTLRLANQSVAQVSDTVKSELAFSFARKSLDHPIFQRITQDNYDYGLSLRFIGTAPLFGQANRWVVGFAPRYGLTTEQDYCNPGLPCTPPTPAATGRSSRTDASRQVASLANVYAEDYWNLAPRWTLVGGGQYAVATRTRTDALFGVVNGVNYGSDGSYDRSYQGFSPKLGVLYALAPKVQLFGNVSKSFEPPSFGEGPQVVVGGPLKAQRAITYELGSRGTLAGVNWDLSLYRAEIRNELLAQQIAPNGASATINADHTVHQGVEAGGAVKPLPWLTARLSALYNDFRYDGDRQYGNNLLPGVPRVFLRGELRGDWHQQFVALTSEASPAEQFIDMANTFAARGYALLGAKAGGALLPTLAWYLEGRNLLDQHYAASTGVIANAGGKDQAQFLPGDGVSVYAGLTWTP